VAEDRRAVEADGESSKDAGLRPPSAMADDTACRILLVASPAAQADVLIERMCHRLLCAYRLLIAAVAQA
jgi:hypothetical protein